MDLNAAYADRRLRPIIVLHYLLSGCCCTIDFTAKAVLRFTAVQHAH